MVYVKDIAQLLETWAPLAFQASYDNSGLLVGDPSMLVTGVLVALDVTEEVLQEAKDKGCNLLVTHHPIIFK
jgi:putative NIF3 family GTP cyclohydrolase 1 type 2